MTDRRRRAFRVAGPRDERRGTHKTARKTPANKKSPFHDLKVEVAGELGLMDKVYEMGWAELTAAESGRIGGVMTRRLRELGLIPKPSAGGKADDRSGTTPPGRR